MSIAIPTFACSNSSSSGLPDMALEAMVFECQRVSARCLDWPSGRRRIGIRAMSVRRQERSIKSELYGMFEADQAERQGYPPVGTSEYRQLRTRDAEGRQRVAELMVAIDIKLSRP